MQRYRMNNRFQNKTTVLLIGKDAGFEALRKMQVYAKTDDWFWGRTQEGQTTGSKLIDVSKNILFLTYIQYTHLLQKSIIPKKR